jgi:predicted nucleic acid-binding Zn ribbon protein
MEFKNIFKRKKNDKKTALIKLIIWIIFILILVLLIRF